MASRNPKADFGRTAGGEPNMKSTSLALIDIEAEGRGRRLVTADAVEKVGEALGIVAPPPKAAMSDAVRGAVEAVLGQGTSPTEVELAVLSRAVRALPPVSPRQSFVWTASDGPSEVERLMRAVVVYHRFNVQAVEVSERIGANDDFRRFVRQCNAPEETELREALETERRHVDRISSFMESLNSFAERASAVFDGAEWDIGSILVLTAAVGGLVHSRAILSDGWDLPHVPSEACLDAVEALRMELSFLSREVRDSHGVNLMGYSLSALSGIRRSLFDGGADFRSALSTFGIDEEDDDRLVALAANVRHFLETCDRLDVTLVEAGYGEADLPAVMNHVLLRKYLVAAAEATGLEWESVAPALRPRATVTPAEFGALLTSIEQDSFSAKLDNISRDRGQSIVNVVLAAEHYVYSRLYWIDAGARVVACDPGIRLMDLRSILEMEPEIHTNTEVLSRAGAIDREDVGMLEDHLEWLIGVYGLPVPNAAITRIVESRGDALAGLVSLG